MNKKEDKPYMPFYIGDWFKAPEIRALPHANRMVWFEILCIMWQSDEKGCLTINGKPFVITNDITGEITNGEHVLASMLGISCEFLQESFRLFKKFGVFKVREDGSIYSGFMVKLIEIKKVRASAGRTGMKNRYSKDVISRVITNDITISENENEYMYSTIIRVLEDSSVLNGESENEKKVLGMVVLEMEKIWLKEKPQYNSIKGVDYPALMTIAYHIASRKGWTKHSVTDIREMDVINSWTKIVLFLASSNADNFLKKQTLDGVANPKIMQRIEEAMSQLNNGRSKGMIL
jgi:hypothetical protein